MTNGYPNQSHLMEVPMNSTTNQSAAMGLTSDFRKRNLACGSLGLIINVAAVVFLIVTRNVKHYLKASLVSLTLSDISFMCTLIVYGMIKWSGMSEEPLCRPIAVMIAITITVMYCTTAQLALYNYAAVYHPHRFKAWATLKIAVTASICTWALAITMCVLTVRLPAKSACLPILGVSGMRSIPIFTVWDGSSILIIVLNIAVLLKLRKRTRTFMVNNSPVNVTMETPIPRTNAPVSESINSGVPAVTPLFDEPSTHAPMPISALAVSAGTPRNGRPSARAPGSVSSLAVRTVNPQFDRPRTQSNVSIATLSVPEITLHHGSSSFLAPVSISTLPVPAVTPCCDRQRTLAPVSSSSLSVPLSKTSKPEHQQSKISSISSEILVGADLSQLNRCPSTTSTAGTFNVGHSIGEERWQGHRGRAGRDEGLNTLKTSNSSTPSSGREVTRTLIINDTINRSIGSRLKKVNLTLSLITFWCCFLMMPFAVYIVWVVQLPEEERPAYALAPAGIFGSSLITVTSIGNPFLYAWRFLNWSRVLRRLKRMFCK